MRIVHISTYDVAGGAARAAFRTHEALLAAGQQSAMLVRSKRSPYGSVTPVVRPATAETFFTDLIQHYCIDQNRTGISTTYFSLGWPGEDLSQHPLIQGADVIHLHWVSGFVSPSSLVALGRLGKPLVWTLHDQRAFTGGCHYSAGCTQFETDCAACPQLASDPCRLTAANLADQLRALVAPITVIAPSQWMGQCARRSAVFARSRIEVIPYGIETRRFWPMPQQEARARLALPADNFLLLFGVDNVREKRKGLRELFMVLKSIGEGEDSRLLTAQQKPQLLCFGDVDSAELPVSIKPFGRIQSDEFLSCLYSAADLFLLPSIEDNFPNTVLEAMSCGTPVAAFSIGGVPDMIVHNQTGFLVQSGDLKELRKIIGNSAQGLKTLQEMRPRCRQYVETHFTYAIHARACMALYNDLLSSARRNQPTTRLVPNSDDHDLDTSSQRLLAPLLKFVFDLEADHLFSTLSNSAPGKSKFRVARFRRQVKRTLKRALKASWSYPKLMAALEAHLAVLQAPRFGRRIKAFLRRMLRSS